MSIMSEGIKMFIVAGIGILVSFPLLSYSKILGFISLFIFTVFALFSLYFFRDPIRNKTFSSNQITSPGDGVILSIEKTDKEQVIRIFLSIFNVHIQRSPMAGTVKSINFIQGKFHVAYKPEAKDNQRNLIEIETDDKKTLIVEQITGAIARRIVAYVKVGQKVNVSEKIGMIYFGSQVALHLPLEAKIIVNKGDKVFAGETLLGTL